MAISFASSRTTKSVILLSAAQQAMRSKNPLKGDHCVREDD
jgi:hypothetical protein